MGLATHVLRGTRFLHRVMSTIADYAQAALVTPKSLVIREWVSQNQVGKTNPLVRRLCLFAHFDASNRIEPYVVFYLQSLLQLGITTVFISASDALGEDELAKVLPYCEKVILRKNISLDFGSWKIGLLETVGWTKYQELILANDSVYGPLFPLGKVFEEMEKRNLDYWGITSSQEVRYHLQSYFLVFNLKVLQSKAFNLFWDQFRFFRNKPRIISRYEIGLTELAEKEGWKFGAYIESSALGMGQLNPTLFSWDNLIEKHHCPFLKTEVLRLNRGGSSRISQWKDIVASSSSYDQDLIVFHLERGNRSDHPTKE